MEKEALNKSSIDEVFREAFTMDRIEMTAVSNSSIRNRKLKLLVSLTIKISFTN